MKQYESVVDVIQSFPKAAIVVPVCFDKGLAVADSRVKTHVEKQMKIALDWQKEQQMPRLAELIGSMIIVDAYRTKVADGTIKYDEIVFWSPKTNQVYCLDVYAKLSREFYQEFRDTSHLDNLATLITFAAEQSTKKRQDNFRATHLSHCYQGEYEDSCKYGDDDICPANPKNRVRSCQ